MDTNLNFSPSQSNDLSTSSGYENVLSHFKQAALSVTQLYQASTTEVLRAQKAGYNQALREVLELIESGASIDFISQYCLEKLASSDNDSSVHNHHDNSVLRSEDTQLQPHIVCNRTVRAGRPVLDEDDEEMNIATPHKRRVYDLNSSWMKRGRR